MTDMKKIRMQIKQDFEDITKNSTDFTKVYNIYKKCCKQWGLKNISEDKLRSNVWWLLINEFQASYKKLFEKHYTREAMENIISEISKMEELDFVYRYGKYIVSEIVESKTEELKAENAKLEEENKDLRFGKLVAEKKYRKLTGEPELEPEKIVDKHTGLTIRQDFDSMLADVIIAKEEESVMKK
jgi:hypothetical protein